MPTLTFSELPHQGLALQRRREKTKREHVRLYTKSKSISKQKQIDKNMQAKLTVFSSSKVGEDTEGLGLQLGGSFGPISRPQIIDFTGDDGLIHWGSTVYNTVFNWQITATTERAGRVKTHTFLSA